MANKTPYAVEHERGFVEAFVVRRDRERCRQFLGKQRRRDDLLRYILSAELRSGRTRQMAPDDLFAALAKMGLLQRQCYIISNIRRLDQTTRSLEELLRPDPDGIMPCRELLGCTILSIEAGRIAMVYYEEDNAFVLCQSE